MFQNSSFALGFRFTNVTSAAAVISPVNYSYVEQFSPHLVFEIGVVANT